MTNRTDHQQKFKVATGGVLGKNNFTGASSAYDQRPYASQPQYATPQEINVLLRKVTATGDLIIREKQLQQIPVALCSRRNEFAQLIRLNLSGNQIQELDGDVCRGLSNLE